VALLAAGCGRDQNDQRAMRSDSAAPAMQTGDSGPAAATLNQDVREFVERATIANTAEIQLGQLAVARAKHPQVRKFAQTMIYEHTKALNELRDAIGPDAVSVPQVDEKHQDVHRRLAGLQGEAFDREYMKVIHEAHEETEDLMEDRAGSRDASLPQVAEWAAATLPSVRSHKELAHRVEQELNDVRTSH
jgi:putative membrane protein